MLQVLRALWPTMITFIARWCGTSIPVSNPFGLGDGNRPSDADEGRPEQEPIYDVACAAGAKGAS